MKNWKINQKIYHTLNQNFADEYGDEDIELMNNPTIDEIIQTVKDYISGWVPEKVVYPAKSFFVAIVYARLLRDYFDENPLESLSDQDLLYGNDPYFIPYNAGTESQLIYDSVINEYTWEFDLSKGEIPDVSNYFYEEIIKPGKNE